MMDLTLKEIIAHLVMKLGRPISREELLRELNSIGLMRIRQEIEAKRSGAKRRRAA